jgi:hypothetical protein
MTLSDNGGICIVFEPFENLKKLLIDVPILSDIVSTYQT